VFYNTVVLVSGDAKSWHEPGAPVEAPPVSRGAARSTAHWQPPRADGILLTKRRRDPKDRTATANSAKSQEFEAPTRPQNPPPAAAPMLFFAGDYLVGRTECLE